MNEIEAQPLAPVETFRSATGFIVHGRGEGNSSRRSLPTNCHEPFITMKLIPLLLFAGCLAVSAETEEQINKRFAVQPGGKLVVDVDFGSIDISTNASSEVTVDIFRKISRRNKSSEEEFLRERPVTFSQDGNTLTIQSRAKSKIGRASCRERV